MAKKDISSQLQESRVFPPTAAFKKRATLRAADLERMHARAAEDYVGFWADLATRELQWMKPFTVPLDDSQAPNYRWFTDGELNASYNCLDVHLEERGDKTAIIFEGEPGDTRKLSYRELHREVCRFANALKARGIGKGDRVVIYMPLVPEAVVAMQACARIGAVHSVVFGGFSSNAVRDRVEDAGARLVITADGGWRGGQVVELKRAVDKALAEGCPSIEGVIVLKRTGNDCGMKPDRDMWWHDVVTDREDNCEAEPLNAEHPLFLLYTSGSTGKPKGIQHATGGYLLGAKLTSRWTFDLKDSDVFWCTADVGWVTGHTYVAYGPLAAGATVLLYEGAPTFPDGGRFWKNIQTHGVTILYTAPTAIRALMKLGDQLPREYDLSKLRLLGSVGEPINPEAWMWYHRVIGRERCPIVDTWWQTETGVIMMTPVPAVTPTKPGSCTKPLPGIFVDIVDEDGKSVTKPSTGGYLVVRRPWPSMLRTIWGDNERYLSTYWEKFNNRYYVAGDSANRDADGYYWIMGRIDDVLNVAGHRLGTMEIESSLVAHAKVAEAAVVGKPHDVKGESVFAFVSLKVARPEGEEAKQLINELRAWVGEHLSPIAKPDDIRLADNLPKTRSGKIMRRLLRAIARGEDITQDVSTLENPAIVDQLRGDVTHTAAADGHTPARSAARATSSARREVPAARAGAPRANPPAARSAVKTKSRVTVAAKKKAKAPAAPAAKVRAKTRPRVAAKSNAATRTPSRSKRQARGAAPGKTSPQRRPAGRPLKGRKAARKPARKK